MTISNGTYPQKMLEPLCGEQQIIFLLRKTIYIILKVIIVNDNLKVTAPYQEKT